MKKYKIVFILSFLVIVLLSWLAMPNIWHVEDYDSAQLKELKMMAKNNNKKALGDLIFYYTKKDDSENLLLVLCAVHKPLSDENNKIVTISSSGKRASLKTECPVDPIDKIKDRDSLFDKVKYFFTKGII